MDTELHAQKVVKASHAPQESNASHAPPHLYEVQSPALLARRQRGHAMQLQAVRVGHGLQLVRVRGHDVGVRQVAADGRLKQRACLAGRGQQRGSAGLPAPPLPQLAPVLAIPLHTTSTHTPPTPDPTPDPSLVPILGPTQESHSYN